MKNKIKIDFAFNFRIDSDEIRNFYKKIGLMILFWQIKIFINGILLKIHQIQKRITTALQ